MKNTQLKKGIILIKVMKEKEALKIILPLAEKNHIKAQYFLGFMYYEGIEVAPNDKKAVKWFTKAAEQGHAEAQFKLGHMYDFGYGVKTDDTEAIKWYIKAAEQGHATAQNNLGYMGSPQNSDKIAR